MSEETRALTHAIEALAKSNLSVCDELAQSRAIQQDMARTLVALLDGQAQTNEALQQIVERQNKHERNQSHSETRHSHSESRIEILERTAKHHAAEIESIKATRSQPQSAAE